MDKTTQRTRVQLDFTQRTMNQLKRLQDRLDASSRAEVIRKALNHLDAIVSLIDEGAKISVKRPGTDKWIFIEFPLLNK